MRETVHELKYIIFNELVKGQDFKLCKQGCRMISITRIRYNPDGFFLLNTEFVKTGTVCTAIDIYTVYKVRMNHGTI